MDVSLSTWLLTLGFVVALILVDLFLHRNPSDTSIKESFWATILWTAIGLGFGIVVLMMADGGKAGEYFAGYLLERALSIDNVFVFVVILSYFAVPTALQHRALLWGVVGALVLRGIFIAIGSEMLDRFHWTIYLFGAILIYTAFKLITSGDEEVDPSKNKALKVLRKIMPITNSFEGNKVFTRLNGKRAGTPMLAVLVVIGTTDLVFAVDSIPAVFAVTEDPFLVFTSNAFAVLGLRALALLLVGVMDRFVYLKQALAIVLAFVGLKMVGSEWVHLEVWVTLLVITVVITTGIVASLVSTRNRPLPDPDEPALKEGRPVIHETSVDETKESH